MLLRACHYATGERIDIRHEGGRIVAFAPAGTASADREASWIAPALFDLQINGCLGISFNSPTLTAEQVRTVVDECRRHGIGGLLPTLVTGSFEALAHGFRTLRQACETDPVVAMAVPGFHLEGPYIASEDGPRGAHPREHARDPDIDEFRRWQDAAGGRIRLVTLAPERPGALKFIETIAQSGVVVAIAHTAATPAQIRDAVAAGAKLSTHLGNGCHAMLPRHENYIWEQLAADDLWASLIPDGHHLPDSLIKVIVRVKTPSRSIITCDASSLAGMPPGRYGEWGTELDVLPGGKVVVPDTPFLAGSGVFTDTCIGVVMRAAGVSLAEAIDMACARPRELLGLPRWKLKAGRTTPLVLFDQSPSDAFVVREVVS
ncbi:MAG TPA: N-acetylglucosamine-6-phosphate deacetylase [Gemmataceae bacterium]|jgi:N-acetylglucosamine-6-phosphate deacetylase|nr:N-acetylglucosamine-6-phosphate deacetylase [Gemmataceae bacterium]